jgi:hypothetical protein
LFFWKYVAVKWIVPHAASCNQSAFPIVPSDLHALRASFDLDIGALSMLFRVYKLVSRPYVRAICAASVSLMDVATQLPSLLQGLWMAVLMSYERKQKNKWSRLLICATYTHIPTLCPFFTTKGARTQT